MGIDKPGSKGAHDCRAVSAREKWSCGAEQEPALKRRLARCLAWHGFAVLSMLTLVFRVPKF